MGSVSAMVTGVKSPPTQAETSDRGATEVTHRVTVMESLAYATEGGRSRVSSGPSPAQKPAAATARTCVDVASGSAARSQTAASRSGCSAVGRHSPHSSAAHRPDRWDTATIMKPVAGVPAMNRTASSLSDTRVQPNPDRFAFLASSDAKNALRASDAPSTFPSPPRATKSASSNVSWDPQLSAPVAVGPVSIEHAPSPTRTTDSHAPTTQRRRERGCVL